MRQSIIKFATTTARLSRRLMIGITLLFGVYGTGILPAQAAPLVPTAALHTASHHTAPMARAAASGTVYVEITKLAHNIVFDGLKGMMVHMYVEFSNLKDSALRVALFFYYSDDTLVAADPNNAPSAFVTSDGSLTSQFVVTPPYQDTVYKDFTLFVPYVALPTVTGSVDVYVLPSIGLDGQDFTIFGNRAYFTMTG